MVPPFFLFAEIARTIFDHGTQKNNTCVYMEEVKVEPVSVSVSETESNDEEMMDLTEERGAMIEAVVKETVNNWLENHGSQLFALEYSKLALKQQKKAVQTVIKPKTLVETGIESQPSSGSAAKRRRHR